MENIAAYNLLVLGGNPYPKEQQIIQVLIEAGWENENE